MMFRRKTYDWKKKFIWYPFIFDDMTSRRTTFVWFETVEVRQICSMVISDIAYTKQYRVPLDVTSPSL